MKNLAPRAALLALALSLLIATPAPAQMPLSPVEGTWSFLGGRIAVERQEDGSFLGTIIRRTDVDVCPQKLGERLWIDIRLQNDGSYWGEHQFFRTSPGCEVVPERGNAAFRVLNRSGVTFLRVCLADPETPDVQPKIAEDGTATDANAGCRDAEFFDLLPTKDPKLKDIVTLTSGTCGTTRRFGIRLTQPRGDALKRANAWAKGRKLRLVRNGERVRTKVAVPRGTKRLRIVARTARGQVIKGKRRVPACT